MKSDRKEYWPVVSPLEKDQYNLETHMVVIGVDEQAILESKSNPKLLALQTIFSSKIQIFPDALQHVFIRELKSTKQHIIVAVFKLRLESREFKNNVIKKIRD